MALAVLLSLKAGTPASDDLPEVALRWRLLFHVERAGALIAVVGLIALVTWRTSRGEFPSRFAQMEYPPRAVTKTNASFEELEDRVRLLEVFAQVRPEMGIESDDGEA